MSSPKAPKPQPIPERPKVEDPAVQKARQEAIARRQRARGYRSTMLSKNFMSEDASAKLETLGS